MKWIKRKRSVLVGLVIFLVVCGVVWWMDSVNIERLLEFEPPTIAHGAAVFIALYALKGLIMFPPPMVLYIAAGSVFSVGWGIAITYVAMFICLSVSYFVGRKMGRERIWKLVSRSRRLAKMLGDEESDNRMFLCFLVRVLPVPRDLFGMFCGATGVPYLRFMVASILGASLFMLPVVIAGAAIADPLTPGFLVPFGAALLVSVASFFVYKGHGRRVRRGGAGGASGGASGRKS